MQTLQKFFSIVLNYEYLLVMVSLSRVVFSHRQVILVSVSLFWLHSSQAAGPHLLISKVILNEYTVEGKDLTIQYSIYNVGEG